MDVAFRSLGPSRSARHRCSLQPPRLLGWLLCLLLLTTPSFLPAQSTGAGQQVLTNDSILKMLTGGFGEELVLTSIEQQPGKYSLGVDDMIALRNAGVSDRVIQAMLRRAGSAAAATPPPAPAVPLVLPDGTVVQVIVKRRVSSATALVGDPVPAETAADVVVAGVVVARRGSAVTAAVSAAAPAKRAKIGGNLEIEFRSLTLLDGSTAKLRQVEDDKRSIASSAVHTTGKVLNAARSFGLAHGKEAVVESGATRVTYVDGAISLDRQKLGGPVAAPVSAASIPPAVSVTPPIPGAATPAAAAPLASPKAEPALKVAVLKKPNRVEFTDDSGRVVATQPLLSAPSAMLTDPVGHRLFVRHSTRSAARISGFDLMTGTSIGMSDASLAETNLKLSEDGSHLIAYGSDRILGGSNSRTKQILLGLPADSSIKVKAGASYRVLDSKTLEPKSRFGFGEYADTMRYLQKQERLMVITPRSRSLYLIDPKSGHEPQPIELGGRLIGSAITADGARILCLIRNTDKKGKHLKRGGELRMVELATGRALESSKEIEEAQSLIRFGKGDEFWVTTEDRMRRVSPEGKPTTTVVLFKEHDKELGKGLDGYPGPTLAMGNRYAINVLRKNGTLAYKVALLNPESGKVDSVTPFGRSDVRAGKKAGRWALAILATAASAAAAGTAASAAPGTTFYYPVFFPGSASQVRDMVVRPDQQALFVMCAESDDVTVIKADGSVAATIPVKSGDSRLWSAGEGKFVYHVAPSKITVLNASDFKMVKEIPIEKGFSPALNDKRGEFYLCDKSSCQAWNADRPEAGSPIDVAGMKQRLVQTVSVDGDDDDDAEEAADKDPDTPAAAEEAAKSAETRGDAATSPGAASGQ